MINSVMFVLLGILVIAWICVVSRKIDKLGRIKDAHDGLFTDHRSELNSINKRHAREDHHKKEAEVAVCDHIYDRFLCCRTSNTTCYMFGCKCGATKSYPLSRLNDQQNQTLADMGLIVWIKDKAEKCGN